MSKRSLTLNRVKRSARALAAGSLLLIWLMATGFATVAHSPRSADLPIALSFSPASPSIADSVNFFVAGEWQNGCTPEFSSLAIFPTDHVVRIDAVSNPNDMACTQSVTPFDWQASTFFERVGSYQVFLYVKEGAAGQPALVAATVIDVKGGMRLSPAIAALGDPITVIVSDMAATTCVPEFQGRTLVNDLVYIEVMSPAETEGCAAVATPWDISVPLSDLAPAAYSVQLRVTEAGGALSSGRVIYRDQLYVLENLYRTFFPIMAPIEVGE